MYIKRIEIDNVKCFGSGRNRANIGLQRPDGSCAGWTVVAGRNGSGKSTFLRAIALAVAGPWLATSLQKSFAGWVRNDETRCYSQVEIVRGEADKFQPSPIRYDNEVAAGIDWKFPYANSEPEIIPLAMSTPGADAVREPNGPWSRNPDGWFIAAYGPFRHLPSRSAESQSSTGGPRRVNQLASLFREDMALAEAISWLKEIYLRRLEGRPGAQELEKGILALLNDGLLPGGMHIQRVDSDGLWVKANGNELPLKELSDGYRTVAALIVDIARQLFDTYGEFNVVQEDGVCKADYPGVVLIDEMDAHLHVSWQQQIGFWLKSRFPGIQFIVSTHSPFICQAADPNGLIRLPAPGEERTVEHIPEHLYTIVKNGSADEAVLTELFGLETSHSQSSESLREELAQLEVLLIKGKAGDAQKKRYEQLLKSLPDTQDHMVQQALRTLGKRSKA